MGRAGTRERDLRALASPLPTCSHGPRIPQLATGGAVFLLRLGQPANTPSPSACSSSLLPHSRNRHEPSLHPSVPRTLARGRPLAATLQSTGVWFQPRTWGRGLKPEPAGWAGGWSRRSDLMPTA